jgi:two-component system phosphate regulon sensor histidine kinase PhoR
MQRKHLFWFLIPSYWILIAVTIVIVALYAFHAMSSLYFQAMEHDIRTRAILFAEQIAPLMEDLNSAGIDALCKKLGSSANTRFTIILPDGEVAGDSNKEPASMEYHGDRPEIRNALDGQVGMDKRYSNTLKEEMMYVAVPLKDSGSDIRCAVRAALPMTAIKGQLNAMILRIFSAALLAGLLAMGVCIVVVRRITYPLRGMCRAACRFAEGDFTHRIPAQQAVELDQLADSLNTMSDQLNKTLSTISTQRNEQQAVLASMDEGVLAVDRKERIIHMNRAAGQILGINHHKVKRDLVQQVVRYANLQEFIKAVLGSQRTLSRDLRLAGDVEKQIQASGSVLHNAEGTPIGALVVMRDVTQLRHLETVRSDFVAHVSHELKTPITSIKGFVETLLSDDWDHDADILRFLEIIHQQVGRMNAIIDDLLTLSRMEQKQGRVMKEPTRLAAVLENAIYLCQLQASKKKITIEMACPDTVLLPLNAPLLEQAIVNLIINAIKYSEPGKKVDLLAEEHEEHVVIYVKDEGFGIEHKHFDRLFERFYRVDTARSRKMGGTGLGLSIVKHIVQAHDGTIQVNSKVGSGTTFLITLPKKTSE